MVDTTGKKHSLREAKAQAVVILNKKILELIVKNKIEKGNVLEVAKIAGVFACKKPHLISLFAILYKFPMLILTLTLIMI